MMVTYAIGDIHGCLKELKQLFERIGDYHLEHHRGSPAKYVFIGDYIDRGPDSRGVVDFILNLQDLCSKRDSMEAVTLRGNHEDMLLNDIGLCLYNGGRETFRSYGWKDDTSYLMDNEQIPGLHMIPDRHMQFFRNTILWHKDSLRTYVHAGIYRHLGGIENQSESVMLWIRDEFLQDPSTNGGYVVHGHTPIGVEDKPNRFNLDSACVFGGVLTAAVFVDTQEKPIHLIQSDRHENQGPY